MFKFFDPEKTSNIFNDLFAVKSFVSNAFVFTDGVESFCIDAGYSTQSLKKGFRYLNIDPKSVRFVFLTHSDFDHVGGLPLFSNATIYLNANEEQMTNKRTPRFFHCIHNKKINGNVEFACGNKRFHIGSHTVKIFPTPGHTPGHAAYLVDDKYLFTGDAITFRNGTIQPLLRIFNKDHKGAAESARKLENLKGIEYICTSHFGVHKITG